MVRCSGRGDRADGGAERFLMKRLFNVYLRSRIDDYTGDPSMALHYEDFVGSTWAASAAQAVNNVRFRNGDKHNRIYESWGTAFYLAIPAGEDKPELHENFIRWADTH